MNSQIFIKSSPEVRVFGARTSNESTPGQKIISSIDHRPHFAFGSQPCSDKNFLRKKKKRKDKKHQRENKKRKVEYKSNNQYSEFVMGELNPLVEHNVSPNLNASSQKIVYCPFGNRCVQSECMKEHPYCFKGNLCDRFFCSYSHPNGRRDIPCPKPVQVHGSIENNPISQRDFYYQQSEPDSYIEPTEARGYIQRISKEKKTAAILPFMPSISSQAVLKRITKRSEINLDLKDSLFEDVLLKGDFVSFQLSFNSNGQPTASFPHILRFGEEQSSRDILKVIHTVVTSTKIDPFLLEQILRWNQLPLHAVQALIKSMFDCVNTTPHLFSSGKVQSVLMDSPFLYPDGFLCRQISFFSKDDILALKEIVSRIFILNLDRSRLVVHLITVVAEKLASLGENGLGFQNDILRAGLPLKTQDSLRFYPWSQLPCVPLRQEVTKIGKKPLDLLESLPSVRFGAPYPDIETYVSTYLRLHRADCYFDLNCFLRNLKDENFSSGYKDDRSFAVFNRLIPSKLTIAQTDSDARICVQLSAVIENPEMLKFKTLSEGNMVVISLEGSFKDQELIWGIVVASPSINDQKKMS